MRLSQEIARLNNEYSDLEDKVLSGEIESENAIKRQHQIMNDIKKLANWILDKDYFLSK